MKDSSVEQQSSLDAQSSKASQSKWQKDAMPLMSRMVVGLTLFFFIASFAQLYYLHRNIGDAPKINIEESFANLTNHQTSSFKETMAISTFKAFIMLEANALERRHHQANVLLMSRVWVRYLGFVTGMILALVGAAFILGKLQEQSTELTGKSQNAQLSLKSSSPGIIFSSLGVLLMLVTIVTHHKIEVRDGPVYSQSIELFQATSVDKKKLTLDK